MKKLTAALVATLLVCAGVASARTWYVSPTGTDTTCASPTSTVGPLSKPNADAHTGDVIIMAAGNYATDINPARSGTSASSRITYEGNLSNPAATTVSASLYLTKDYVTVKGLSVQQMGATVAGLFDSVSTCVIWNTPSVLISLAHYTVFYNCTVTTGRLDFNDAGLPLRTRGFVIDNSTFNITQDSDYSQAAWRVNYTDSLKVIRSRMYVTITPNGNHGWLKVYHSGHFSFRYSLLDVTQNRPTSGCDECGISYYRDSTQFMWFGGDTMVLRGPAGISILASASGSFPATTLSNKWDSLLVRDDAPYSTAEPIFHWQNGARADTFTDNVVITSNNGGITQYAGGGSFNSNCLVQNNTFVSLSSSFAAMDSHDGPAASAATWRDNIYYSRGYYAWNYTSDSDYDILFAPAKGSAAAIIRSGSALSVAGACSIYNKECHGRYADPVFVGGANVFTFDAHLASPASPALTGGHGGGYVGAYQYVAGPVTFYVNAGAGLDTNDGLTAATPWKTIARANSGAPTSGAIVIPGDRVYVAPGSYTAFPNPDSAESRPGWIRFIGTNPNGDPIANAGLRAANVPNGALTKNHVVLTGLSLGSVAVTGVRDSLLYNSIAGDFSLTSASYTCVDHCVSTGATFAVSGGSGMRVNSCSFPRIAETTPALAPWRIGVTDSLRLFYNTFGVTVPTDGTPAIQYSAVTNMIQRSNSTTATASGTQATVWRQINGCHDNAFAKDTLVVLGGTWNYVYPSNATTSDTTTATRWGAWKCNMDSCYWNGLQTSGTSFFWQGGMSAWNVRYSVLATNGMAMRLQDVKSKSLVNHCTLLGRPVSQYGEKSVVAIVNDNLRPALSDTAFTLTNTIICGTGYAAGVADTLSGGVAFYDAIIDSAKHSVNLVDKTQTKILSNNNLYAVYPSGTTVGDRSWLNFDAPNARRTGSWRANGVATWWNTDSLSTYGSPQFFDSTQAGFDGRLLPTSQAIARGTSGSDIGAIAYNSTPFISVYPAQVTLHLAAGDTTYTDVTTIKGTSGISVEQPALSNVRGSQFDFLNGADVATPQPKTVMDFGQDAQFGAGDVFRIYLTARPGSALTGDATVYVTVSDPNGSHNDFRFPLVVHVLP